MPPGIVSKYQIVTIEKFVNFCTFLFNEWWFSCPLAASAPQQDLKLATNIQSYAPIDKTISDVTLKALNSRGGVEDTRLEAKAKDTKKPEAKAKNSLSEDRPSQGQGQECLRPRPKDQENRRKCFPKKKGLQNNFSGNLQFIGVARIFDWGNLNHKSHAMTSSKNLLVGT